jgi:hypothetical protein
VAVAAAETHLQHAVRDQEDVDVEEGLLHVGRVINKINQCNELEFKIAFDDNANDCPRDLIMCNDELTGLVNTLPDPERFNDIVLSCNPDVFLEVLMGNIRNTIISFQAWHQKVKQAKVISITNQLNSLKINFKDNAELIFRLETELVNIRDTELAAKFSEIKLFEHLHHEKPSPHFLNLIKCSNKDSLSAIKGKNGEELHSEQEREDRLVQYFSDVYCKKKQGTSVNFDNCITDFLGQEICESPVVRNSKLTADEKEALDRPLSIGELDDSLSKCNLKSAAGSDGFSNKLIKLCWQHLRIPLFNYANFCFTTGLMTHNFRSASIKLIPKKGDLGNLKNWRPISLLSNMYKIISRAFNLRLKKVVNRICSRAQKGYNSDRYVQEVLINVCETIAHCKQNNIRGCVLAVDMAKAFDTLNHDFIKSVYRFFGLGENIIRWLDLLGNQRQACIIMDEGKCTKYFDLETGRAQGDNLSPFIFNFCEQVLIFKLELDPDIIKIPRNFQAFRNVPGEVYSAESNRETSTNESLADDNTVLSVINRESLLKINTVLKNFSIFSGLECNFDKTSLMPIFPISNEESEWVQEAGFTVVNKLRLLGADITANFEDLQENFIRIKEKILNLANYWSRFKLSLPGRIAIAKTFLISQLNYLGCVFCPNEVTLREIQNIVNNFLRNNLRISDERISLSPKKGGLGFFNLSDFLEAQRATWLLRANKNCIDNWRYDLHLLAPANNVLLIRTCDVDRNFNPILYNIVEAYVKFYNNFCRCGDNYNDAQVFMNSIFRDPENNSELGINFFGRDFYNLHKNTLRSLTYNNCFVNRIFRTRDQFAEIGLPLNLATWMRIRNSVSGMRPTNMIKTFSTDINNFCLRWRKGGKQIRMITRKIIENAVSVRNLRCFRTYSELVSTVPDPDVDLGPWYESWNISSLPNDFRMFIFNCRNNSLPLNNRLGAYLEEVVPVCTYCSLLNIGNHRDSFHHCFLGCQYAAFLLNKFLVRLGMGDQSVYNLDFRLKFWYGVATGNTTTLHQLALIIVFDAFRYIFFKNRRRRKILSADDFLDETVFLLKNICKYNKKLKNAFSATFPGTQLLQAMG